MSYLYTIQYTDLSLVKSGYHGEGRKNDGTTIVQKTHHTAVFAVDVDDDNQEWRENHIKSFGGRGVLLIRNPYRTILSSWNHDSKTHMGVMDPLSFESSYFRKFVFSSINRFRLTHYYKDYPVPSTQYPPRHTIFLVGRN